MDYVWLSFRISWLLSNMFETVSNVTQLAVPTASLAMAWSWLSSILYFGLEIALLTLMYLIQLLKQRTPREWKAKSMAIAGWKNWASLIQSMYALRFLLTACLSNCQDKTFLLLFHFRRGKMGGKGINFNLTISDSKFGSCFFGGFFVKMVLK